VTLTTFRVDGSVSQYFSEEHKAKWVREHLPKSVPPDEPNGTKPSNKTLALVFDCSYKREPLVQCNYNTWFLEDWRKVGTFSE